MGTWIEIPVDIATIEKAVGPLYEHIAYPHITLHHLGKKPDAALIEGYLLPTLRDAVKGFTIGVKQRAAEITGAGYLMQGPRDTPVLLVNSRPLCILWDAVGLWLDSSEVLRPLVSRDYGFQPHITLPKPLGHRARSSRFTLTRLLVVQSSDGKRTGEWEVPL